MNASKPESLFQSMEKWIDLYRELHECSHNEAHDAFEDWAEKLRGESADQTTSLFHEAVKASYQEMKAKTDKGIVILNSPAELKAVSYTNTKGETVTSKPLRSLFGGPLLETGKDPLAFKDGCSPENAYWGRGTVYHEYENTLKSVIGKAFDKLAHGGPYQSSRGVINTPAELRANLEKALSDANEHLYKLGDAIHPIDLASTQEIKELATARLKMLDEHYPVLPKEVPVEELRRQAVMTLERNQAYLQNPELFYDGLADEAKEAVATAEARIKMLDGVIERQKERGGNKLTLKRK